MVSLNTVRVVQAGQAWEAGSKSTSAAVSKWQFTPPTPPISVPPIIDYESFAAFHGHENLSYFSDIASHSVHDAFRIPLLPVLGFPVGIVDDSWIQKRYF